LLQLVLPKLSGGKFPLVEPNLELPFAQGLGQPADRVIVLAVVTQENIRRTLRGSCGRRRFVPALAGLVRLLAHGAAHMILLQVGDKVGRGRLPAVCTPTREPRGELSSPRKNKRMLGKVTLRTDGGCVPRSARSRQGFSAPSPKSWGFLRPLSPGTCR